MTISSPASGPRVTFFTLEIALGNGGMQAPITSVPMRAAHVFWELNGLDLVEGA